jgi:CBS-domain-containing membrane protein
MRETTGATLAHHTAWYTYTKEKQMRVADLMQTDLSTVPPDAPVAEVVQTMADGHVSGLPVVDSDGRVLGVVSATDVLQAAAEHEDRKGRATLFEHTTARDIMTSGAVTIEPDADVRQAAQRMLYGEVRRLFVEEKGRLVGVLSQTDIAQAMGSGRL